MFGKNLKKYRTEKGFSQNDLAEKLFVSRQCVSKWESGITQPDLQTLARLSELFDVPIDALIKENEILENKRSANRNEVLLIVNILVTLFCFLAVVTVWRFLPQTIPAHWTNGAIDRYGSRNEVFINEITVGVLLTVDIFVYFLSRRVGDKRVVYISHGIIVLFQVAYLCFIIAMYAKYLINVLSFVSCMSVAFIMCISIAMHPKISKQNSLLGVRTKETLISTAVWNQTNALACYLFSSWSFALYIIDMLWINKLNLLLLFGYVLLTLIVIVYAKKIFKTVS